MHTGLILHGRSPLALYLESNLRITRTNLHRDRASRDHASRAARTAIVFKKPLAWLLVSKYYPHTPFVSQERVKHGRHRQRGNPWLPSMVKQTPRLATTKK